MARKRSKKNDTAANLGYEAQLWQMADDKRWRFGVPPALETRATIAKQGSTWKTVN